MPVRILIATLLMGILVPLTLANPKDWEPSIQKFEAQDKKSPPPKDPILFVGSSSIRMWDLDKAFPNLPTMNRGFGGSEFSDVIKYFDRIVAAYQPRLILVYEGDNDIGRGKSAAEVTRDFHTFAKLVREKIPGAQLAFLPVKPSLKRWELWPKMKDANAAIEQACAQDNRLHYLDTVTPMLGADGKPKPGLFADDGLHLNEAGYAAWNKVVQQWLDKQNREPRD